MKATISAKGQLVIEPETALEAYALKCWSAEFFGHIKTPLSLEATLCVSTKVPEPQREGGGVE